jgi:hypothetical protein
MVREVGMVALREAVKLRGYQSDLEAMEQQAVRDRDYELLAVMRDLRSVTDRLLVLVDQDRVWPAGGDVKDS